MDGMHEMRMYLKQGLGSASPKSNSCAEEIEKKEP
ncbi:uncharacterized protein G2W53_012577 [Senna tora]|uniref:Uncharacterized protein n=1 Tax=Senna tora TaxID=362788 RepID=A0A834TYB7_9FABA|nr:uncharacterized protein G2W53_012577 [Senna tora]